MSHRNKIIIIFSSVFILIILILILLLLARKEQGALTTPTNTSAGVPTTALPPLQVPLNIEPPPPGPQEQDPEIIAADFAERYGSYSNQSNYENLRDLFTQMTPAMRTNIESYMAANPLMAGEYNGMTTRVMRVEVLERTDSLARLKIYTQRNEVSATNPNGRIFYQNTDTVLLKNNLRWLVDSFDWLQQ